MYKRFFLFAFLFVQSLCGWAQISTQPEFPLASQAVNITFNSAESSRLGYFTGELYAHTGLISSESANNSDWKHVIESWGNNSTQPKLTNKGGGIYELIISPDVYSFYKCPTSEKILQLAFVFRSADAQKQTDNIYVTIYNEGLAINITQPSGSSILQKNTVVTLSAQSSEEAALKLWLDGNILAETTGTTLSADHTFTAGGSHQLIAEATADGKSAYDTTHLFVRNEVEEVTKPAAYKKGINYIDDNTIALVLYAPLKEFVFVRGDFNNWQLNSDYLMKKDGDLFWLEIGNLEKGTEYAFQYFIDGTINIADPYSEKVLDPWNDPDIPAGSFPDLKAYPEGKTEGIVSVLETGQTPYNWQVNDFQKPEKNKLVIYELLVRDFSTGQNFQGVIDQLDYLEDLRINVLELMPVNEFEGNESWGYNPSFYFAPDKFYGPKNKLKELIDKCHQRGIAVMLDMVLNHSYGQSPFLQMYMNNYVPTAENPWYNIESPNQTYQWGVDFNHEAAVVKQLVDSVNSFWINEYKVDGFRFDFTKGFTQKTGDGWAYDASRIAILKRMADEIWKRDPEAYVILEHLSDNSEETELANHGMLLWGNMHGSYLEAAKGNVAGSDLSWAMYSERGWKAANLVSYPESHDEERVMYDLKLSGLAGTDYNTRNQKTALNRIGLNALFHLLLPGPKMIWQFGERGYDLSINRCQDGTIKSECRTYPKPPYWHYLNNSDRTDLFRVMAKLNELKQTYGEFSPVLFSYHLAGAVKSYTLSTGGNHVVAVGNFDVENTDATLSFPEGGKWYEFFGRDSIEITSTEQSLALEAGEYRLYSTRKFDDPRIATDIDEIDKTSGNVQVYPNPASSVLNITSTEIIEEVALYSVAGKQLIRNSVPENRKQLIVETLSPGIYLLKVSTAKSTKTKKIVIQ